MAVVEVLGRYEAALWAQGFERIAGVDEAGRGALAGPLVAAAVILPPGSTRRGIRDSKVLERRTARGAVRADHRGLRGRGGARPSRRALDERGLHRSNIALLRRRAARALEPAPDYALTDGFPVPRMPCPALGDQEGRRGLGERRRRLDHREGHAGPHHDAAGPPVSGLRVRAATRVTGRPEHRAVLARLGPSPQHRLSFAGVGQMPIPGLADAPAARESMDEPMEDDIERFEEEREMELYREYRDVLPMFSFVIESERRFYLANSVDMQPLEGGWVRVRLTDAWVWDMFRPARFVSSVQIMTRRDVNVEELRRDETTIPEAPELQS